METTLRWSWIKLEVEVNLQVIRELFEHRQSTSDYLCLIFGWSYEHLERMMHLN